ncbi:MAG: hypothetical protein V4608_11485 [Bacteroidota bacterium]
MPSFNKLPQKIIAVSVLFVVVLFSCSKSSKKLEKYGSVVSAVMHNDSGVFRGFSLGDGFKMIQEKEAGKALEVDSGYVYYEFPIDTMGSFNITYTFDEMGLVEIQSNVFVTNAANTEEVFNKFKSYFDEYYGSSETKMGFNIWSVPSEKYGNVLINLGDESADFTIDKAPGKISVWIYPDKNL